MLLQCADYQRIAQVLCALGLKVGKSDNFTLAKALLSCKISMDKNIVLWFLVYKISMDKNIKRYYKNTHLAQTDGLKYRFYL